MPYLNADRRNTRDRPLESAFYSHTQTRSHDTRGLSLHMNVSNQSTNIIPGWWSIRGHRARESRDCTLETTLVDTNSYFLFVRFPVSVEISKVRASLFQINGVRKEPLSLPDAEGTPVTLNEKVYVPVKEHPDVSVRYLYDPYYASRCAYVLLVDR